MKKRGGVAFSKLTLHDNFTASGSTVLKPDAGAVIELAPNADDTATFALKGDAGFESDEAGRNTTLRFGKGKGLVTVASWRTADGPRLEVSSDAAGDGDVLRIVELNAGRYSTASITNKNAKPVEILFAGGSLGIGPWGTASLFATAENPIVLRGSETSDIRLDPKYFPWYLAGDADRSVVTTGACDVVISQGRRDAKNWGRIYLNHPIAWGHTGDTVACGVEIRTDKDDVLPYGPGTGGLVLSSTVWQVQNDNPLTAILDLNGTTQTVNSLDVSQSSCATNKAAKMACLKFGEGDADGTLKGVVAANVKVCKTGSGTLTLDGATVTKPDVLAGALAVAGETTVNGFGDLAGLPPVLPAEANDANYDYRKGGSPKKVLEASGCLAATPLRVTVNEGGTLAYRNEADTVFDRVAEFVSLDATGAFVKKGAGALSVRGSANCPQTFKGLVCAAEGTLTLSGRGNTNAFWRVTVKKMASTTDLAKAVFSELGLFDANGNRINQKASGYAYRADATAATDLLAEQVMMTPAVKYAVEYNVSRTPAGLFTGAESSYLKLDGTESGESLEAFAITFRLPEGQAAACSYAFASYGGKVPMSWTVETSPDGVNWTVADSRTDAYPKYGTWLPGYAYYCYWYLDGRWDGFAGLPFTFASANEQTEAVTIDGAMLRADKGATLDVSAAAGTPAGIEIDATAPGGTIVGMPSVKNGELRIVNLPENQSRSDLTKAGCLVACTGGLTAADLATWRVTVNGETTRLRVKMDAKGHVGVTTPGLALIIR